MPVLDLKNCTITLSDGGSASVEVKIGEGNLTYSEKKNRQYILDRGALDTVRDGDEVPVDVSFSFTWEWLKGDGDTTVEDILKGGAGYVSSDTEDPCRPYAVDITIENEVECSGTATQTETIVLANFRYESLDHDMKAASVSASGKCNITEAAITRS